MLLALDLGDFVLEQQVRLRAVGHAIRQTDFRHVVVQAFVLLTAQPPVATLLLHLLQVSLLVQLQLQGRLIGNVAVCEFVRLVQDAVTDRNLFVCLFV